MTLGIIGISFLIPSVNADQTVLDKYGSPLVLNEQQIILKNDKAGSISWDEFTKNYTLHAKNGIWHIKKLEKKEKITKAKKGDHIGIKVPEKVRPNDKVFLMK